MDYRTLFSINISHDYYVNKLCPDFTLEPTTDSYRIIRGHRLILKEHSNGITVIAPADTNNKPFIPLSNTLKFEFYLQLKNSDLMSFTQTEQKPDSNSFYRFTNANLNQSDSKDLKRIRVQRNNLSKLGRQSIWGVVEIVNNDSLPEELIQPSEFTIAFEAKTQYWTYYLVTGQEIDNFTYEIEDKALSPILFERTEVSKIINQTESDDVLKMLSTRFPDASMVRFKSTTEVPSEERGRKNIQLLKKKKIELTEKTEKSETVWIDHLPNPPNNNGTKVINLRN